MFNFFFFLHRIICYFFFFFFSSRRRHTRSTRDWEFRRVLFRSPLEREWRTARRNASYARQLPPAGAPGRAPGRQPLPVPRRRRGGREGGLREAPTARDVGGD